MKLFVQLADKKTIHTEADRMTLDKENNMLLAYKEENLVAVADLSAVMYAHIVERKEGL